MRCAQDGFSLAEVIIVLALMAVIAAIALPGWSKLLPYFQLDSAVRQVQSELHNIKMRAAAENMSFQLAFAAGDAAYTVQNGSTVTATKPLADGIAITNTGTISFSPRGTASANRVKLRHAAGACKQVVVSSTGRVRVCKPSDCSQDC